MIGRFIFYIIFVTSAVLNEDWKQKIIILVCGIIVTYIIEGIIQYIFLSARYRKQRLIENNEAIESTYLLNKRKYKQNDSIGYKKQKKYIYLFHSMFCCYNSCSNAFVGA